MTDDQGTSSAPESVSLPLRRSLRGYSRESVDAVVDELTRRLASAEQRVVEAESRNVGLADERDRLTQELERFRQIERSLTQTLALAEESARQTEQRAEEEAEQLRGRARAEADELVREAKAEHDRIVADVTRIREQLAQAVASIDLSPQA